MQQNINDDARAAKSRQRFGKSSEHTKIFAEWSPATQQFFRNTCSLESNEIPILAYWKENETWFLLTTRRMIWTHPDKEKYELLHSDVEDVGFSGGPDKW